MDTEVQFSRSYNSSLSMGPVRAKIFYKPQPTAATGAGPSTADASIESSAVLGPGTG